MVGLRQELLRRAVSPQCVNGAWCSKLNNKCWISTASHRWCILVQKCGQGKWLLPVSSFPDGSFQKCYLSGTCSEMS